MPSFALELFKIAFLVASRVLLGPILYTLVFKKFLLFWIFEMFGIPLFKPDLFEESECLSFVLMLFIPEIFNDILESFCFSLTGFPWLIFM
jgi:hypothetical protein